MIRLTSIATGWTGATLGLAGVALGLASQDVDFVFDQATPGPLILRSAPGDWDYAFNDPGAVLVHDGKLHMFNNGFDGWPTTSGIAYYVSEDGLTWKPQSAGPIFHAADHSFDGFGLVATSAIVTADGEWRLYLTQLTADPDGGVGAIAFRLALADDPLGEWKLVDEPVLQHGTEGDWDDVMISDPMVMLASDGYRMYYSGTDAKGVRRIGLARSDDGIAWKKHGEPLLEPSLEWERGVNYPSVLQTEDGYARTCSPSPA